MSLARATERGQAEWLGPGSKLAGSNGGFVWIARRLDVGPPVVVPARERGQGQRVVVQRVLAVNRRHEARCELPAEVRGQILDVIGHEAAARGLDRHGIGNRYGVELDARAGRHGSVTLAPSEVARPRRRPVRFLNAENEGAFPRAK